MAIFLAIGPVIIIETVLLATETFTKETTAPIARAADLEPFIIF